MNTPPYFCADCAQSSGTPYLEAPTPHAKCETCGTLAPLAERSFAALLLLVEVLPASNQAPAEPGPNSDCLSIEQAAAELGCDTSTIYRLRAKGKLKSPQKAGRSSRIWKWSVHAYRTTGDGSKPAKAAPPARPVPPPAPARAASAPPLPAPRNDAPSGEGRPRSPLRDQVK